MSEIKVYVKINEDSILFSNIIMLILNKEKWKNCYCSDDYEKIL